MATSRQHKKPEVLREAQEAERVAKHMYTSLTQAKADAVPLARNVRQEIFA